MIFSFCFFLRDFKQNTYLVELLEPDGLEHHSQFHYDEFPTLKGPYFGEPRPVRVFIFYLNGRKEKRKLVLMEAKWNLG